MPQNDIDTAHTPHPPDLAQTRSLQRRSPDLVATPRPLRSLAARRLRPAPRDSAPLHRVTCAPSEAPSESPGGRRLGLQRVPAREHALREDQAA